MSLTSEHINKIVSFNVYPTFLGTIFDNVKVLGIMDAGSVTPWIDPVSMHANVVPTLPDPKPPRFNSYLYAKLELSNGTITAIGLPWINGAVVTHDGQPIKIVVNTPTTEDFARLRNLLLLNNYTDFSIEYIDP